MKPENALVDYNSLLKTFLISVASAIFAFLVVFFFSNYSSLFFAYDFDIPASFNLDGISFSKAIDSHYLSKDAMVTILLSKPISAVIGGVIFLFLLMLGTKKPASVIMLLFWLNVFAFNSAFGVLIDDAVAGAGTYEVAVAMNINNAYLIVITIILAFILFKIGMMNGKLIMLSFPNQKLSAFGGRIIFFITIFIIPWILVVIFTCYSMGGLFSISGVLKNLPVIILLIPFLTAEKPENLDFKYLPTERFLKKDLIFSILFILISILLIVVMKNGITISG